ncbi:unnamed protein product [Auanema sp. JU1783]|nr:unnamed protein product [Auanema sp. JU1783]
MKSVLIFLSLLGLAVADCPSGWFGDGDGMCYKIFANLTVEPTASESCESLGGSLVMIQNAFTETLMYSQPYTTNVIWIGINCRGHDITTCYYEDGTQLTTSSYNNFYPGYPDVNKGLCTYMSLNGINTGKWYNLDCDGLQFGYACQKSEKNSPTQTTLTCPPGYSSFNGYCYKVSMDILSYADAEYDCNLNCGHITSIFSDDENNYVTQLAQASSGGNLFARIGPKYENGVYCNPCGQNCCGRMSYSNFAHSDTELGNCVGIALTNGVAQKGQWMNTFCDKPMLTVCKTAPNAYPCAPPAPTIPPVHTNASYTSCAKPIYFTDNGTVHSIPRTSIDPCTFIISVGKGRRASIMFKEFKLDSASSIELYNDYLETTPFKVLSYGDNPVRQTFTSHEESMKIVYSSRYASSNSTWSFSYGPNLSSPTPTPAYRGDGCNNGVLSSPGTITSPNYPSNYPKHADCQYSLKSYSGRRVFISFSDVRTEAWDKINIYDGTTASSPLIGSLSGYYPTNTNYTSTGSFMFVTFKALSEYTYPGFAATFKSV